MELPYSRRFAERQKHGSDHRNVVWIAGKTPYGKVFEILPIEVSGVTSMRYLLRPFEHLIHRCFLRPVQPGGASDDGPFDNLWVSGSEENRCPDRSIRPIQARVPDDLSRL